MKRKHYLNDLEKVFQAALSSESFTHALKAKELQEKEWARAENKEAEKVAKQAERSKRMREKREEQKKAAQDKKTPKDIPLATPEQPGILTFISQEEIEKTDLLQKIQQEIEDIESTVQERDHLQRENAEET